MILAISPLMDGISPHLPFWQKHSGVREIKLNRCQPNDPPVITLPHIKQRWKNITPVRGKLLLAASLYLIGGHRMKVGPRISDVS